MIVASAVMGASGSLLLAGATAAEHRQPISQARVQTLALAAFGAVVLAIGFAKSINGALILLLVPIGAAAVTFDIGWAAGSRLRGKRIGCALAIALAVVCIVAYTLGFPVDDAD